MEQEKDVYTRAVWAILGEMEYDQFRPELVDILKQFFPEQDQGEQKPEKVYPPDDEVWVDDIHLL